MNGLRTSRRAQAQSTAYLTKMVVVRGFYHQADVSLQEGSPKGGEPRWGISGSTRSQQGRQKKPSSKVQEGCPNCNGGGGAACQEGESHACFPSQTKSGPKKCF